ncbi:MAG: RNA methyltransferase [Firmicutes bacterium]|nr:RNA methyltransferase [Bacillota bacterium]
MEVIRSADNLKLKHVKKLLADKAYRAENAQYVVEGARWVLDAANFKPQAFCAVFVCQSRAEKFSELLAVVHQSVKASLIFTVESRVFDKIADTEHSQGILAVLAQDTAIRALGDFCLYLNGIRDPGNLGTIIRTAAAAGFNDVILDACADVYNPKTVRSSMSALLKVHVFCAQDISLGALKQNGYTVYAADMRGENIFSATHRPKKAVLIIGSEADGVDGGLLQLADTVVSIPMRDTESLNAAVSAGIILYQLKNFEGSL